MRMCANVPAQHAIQTALGGYQSINELIVPGGRFSSSASSRHKLLNDIPGVSCVEPRGALYCFPRLDPEIYPIESDEAFVIDLLRAKKILVTHGTGFNWFDARPLPPGHAARRRGLTEAIGRIADFLETCGPEWPTWATAASLCCHRRARRGHRLARPVCRGGGPSRTRPALPVGDVLVVNVTGAFAMGLLVA